MTSEHTALKLLGTQSVWAMDELPPTIDVGILRRLDSKGWIQVRAVWMQNVAQYPDDPTPPVPSRDRWFSPIRNARHMGDWDAVSNRLLRDAWHHPPELSLNDEGLAELDRIRDTARLAGKGGSRKPSLGWKSDAIKVLKDAKKPLTLTEVASRIGTRPQYISRAINGGKHPDLVRAHNTNQLRQS